MNSIRLHMISGPTSCGKSTFLKQCEDDYDAVIFPRTCDVSTLKDGGRYALHYNILRPQELKLGDNWLVRTRRGVATRLGLKTDDLKNPFQLDPFLRTLDTLQCDIEATVLAAPRHLLLDRISKRFEGEPNFQTNPRSYKQKQWINVYESVDLLQIYRQWLEFLCTNPIPYQIIDSSDRRFHPIAEDNKLFEIVGS